MRTRLFAAFGALALSACVWSPPHAAPTCPVEYPIRHYVIHENDTDLSVWKTEVRAFRTSLREKYNVEVSLPKLVTDSKEAEFIDRAVDPKRLVWRDPRFFFRTPVLLSWWEVIDERGRVVRIYVVASNQSKAMDTRILAWCVNDKLWQPGELEGSPTTTIRSASINLGESKYHLHYWQKQAGPRTVVLIAILGIGIPVWLFAHVLKVRKARRERLESLKQHLAHKPYHAPSIDEPPRL